MKNGVFFSLLFFSIFSFGQQIQFVDFTEVQADLHINPVLRRVVGKLNYYFIQKSDIDTIRIDGHMMSFSNVKINNVPVAFKATDKALLLFEGFKKGENKLTFEYEVFPKQAMYFVNWNFTEKTNTPMEIQGQIWTQGQGRYTSHWFPSFDDVNEKVIFKLDITFEKSFEVISNGILKNKIVKGDDITWQYEMKCPMSSYLLMLAIGHFEKKTLLSARGIPLEQYYQKADKHKIEPTYRYSQKIFDFFEKEIGFFYPWQVYRQVPVMDFLYAGMENTSATLFSDEFVVNDIGFLDRNYISVNAHELAHQWFGNLVTAQSGRHHWLQEGFATYYALLAAQEIYGEDYFYWELLKTAQQLAAVSKTDTIPLLNEKASTLTFYNKGAWVLHLLREEIGEVNFKTAVQRYLEKYAFKTVTTATFFDEIKKVSDFDLETFRREWLEKPGFDLVKANALLEKKSNFIKKFLALQEQRIVPLKEKYRDFREILKSKKTYYPLKVEVLNQLQTEPFILKEKLLIQAMQSEDLKVRQAVASSVDEIPKSFRSRYETFLDDRSYLTQEIALFQLWKQFPEYQLIYLEKSKNWIGFSDRNLELLRLTLILATPKCEEKIRKEAYYKLLQYTGTNYDSSIRQNALENLLRLNLISRDVIKSLVYATTHHRWQFSKFAREAIRSLLKEKKYKKIAENLSAELMEKEYNQIKKLLEE